jgi:hypothetical protein
MVKVKFKESRFYNGKQYKEGDIVEMTEGAAKIYINFQAANYYIESTKKLNLQGMPYKLLQNLCKKYGIPAVGKKEELVASLTKIGI